MIEIKISILRKAVQSVFQKMENDIKNDRK
jgi:hypothetical protein